MDVEAELLKSMQKEDLEGGITAKIESFHGLLTREAAMRLIAKERGLLKREEKSYRLGDIPKGEKRVCFKARVRKVWPVADYASGKRSRVVEVEDETGSMPFVLWNQDVELGNALRSKDELLVKGAYERNGELHLGYSGTLKVTEKAGFSPLDGLEDGQNVHLRGFVAKMEGQDSFVKGTDTVQGFSFMLSDGKSERRCVMLGGLERAGKLEEGDDVIIENGTVRNGNVEIDSDVRVLSRRARDMLIGELSMLECEGEKLLAKVGEKEVALDRLNALRFLGVQAADDIDLCTVVNLKKDALINNRMAVRIQQREGQIIIR